MKRIFYVACAALLLAACAGGQQRGMVGSAYVSTSRPSLAIEANNMPLATAGEGTANLTASGMLGGLPVRVWLAVYGDAKTANPAIAITAHAEVPRGWYWDGIMRRPFSVNDGMEVFGDVAYQAYTYIVDPKRDPFSVFMESETKSESDPKQWMARAFAARYNFYDDKIVLEYREPLPEGIVSLSALPMGLGDAVAAFEQRARAAFSVGQPPAGSVRREYAATVRWRYMDERFLGTVSKYDSFAR
ncbi:MAG: conserved hypothetical protein [Candidatus Desulfovibrio kirbyi]|jgi:hypothetical protein|uniref:Lipoprotein n=1 Tax=Candidatus Desulfovibrio kirbyi TaxID=2696086 RepID=A0A6L2R4S3_9BACT|nr:DUF4851 domain-containing protein [Desulfovibrio sp.]GFH62529.1 MAG: conserved hypothetical protein [Candidatus Desulfovibrio kirbyi]